MQMKPNVNNDVIKEPRLTSVGRRLQHFVTCDFAKICGVGGGGGVLLGTLFLLIFASTNPS